jgi:hypothetical protein
VANGVVYGTAADGGWTPFGAAGAVNCSASTTVKTCTPLWDVPAGLMTRGSPAIVDGVLFVSVPGDGDVDAFSL